MAYSLYFEYLSINLSKSSRIKERILSYHMHLQSLDELTSCYALACAMCLIYSVPNLLTLLAQQMPIC